MILTGYEIMKRLESGKLDIQPYNPDNVNPNSYDLTLGSKLLTYNNLILDSKHPHITSELEIPASGYILRPGELYIGSVNEFIRLEDTVGVLYGKSSLGRLGLFIHVTAGFIDSGYRGNLTLELAVVKPLKVYPNMKIGQIAFHEELGDSMPYAGKYLGDKNPQASKSHQDFKK
jgi:dCTP deaminase